LFNAGRADITVPYWVRYPSPYSRVDSQYWGEDYDVDSANIFVFYADIMAENRTSARFPAIQPERYESSIILDTILIKIPRTKAAIIFILVYRFNDI
jgi:hypothetical protein